MKDFIDKAINSINWKVGKFNTLPIVFGTVMAIIDVVMMSGTKMIHEKTLSSVWTPALILLYSAEPLVFLKSLNHGEMVIMNLIWDLCSDILVTLQGVLVFGETIKGLKLLGVCLSLISLALMSYTDIP